mgnify:CR=1 FL=1
MKKSLIKNNFKTILKTRRRFISMLVMAFLGVGFYSGLVATSPDMQDSLDKYCDKSKMYDIKIVSTLGLTDEDVNAIKEIDGVNDAYGLQTKDSMAIIDDKDSPCKVIEYNENINVPAVIAGKLPQNSNECLLDKKYVNTNNIEDYIGKTIVLQNEDKDENDNEIFTQKEFKITGIAESSLYISSQRGNTSIGNGNLSFYIYVKDDVIKLDYYTEMGVIVKNTEEIVTNSEEYLEKINPVIKEIDNIKEKREEARYNTLVDKANQKLLDAKDEYNKNKLDVDNKLNSAQKKIDDAKDVIQKSEEKLNKSEKELNSKEVNANKKFEDAENKLKLAEKQIIENEEKLKTAKEKFEKNEKTANESLKKLNEQITTLTTNINKLQTQKETMISNGLDITKIDTEIVKLQITLKTLNKTKIESEGKLKKAKKEIEENENKIIVAKGTLKNQKSTLQTEKTNAYNKIKKARADIKSGKEKLQKSKTELEEKEEEFIKNKNEAENKLNEAQEKLNDAEDEIGKIEKAKWYVQDRLDNSGYSNIFDAIKTMSNISKMFPVIFYFVAVLISLTSMTRMIEEERIEIGTLKSLGYNNFQIVSKYIIYAFFACVFGGIIGMSVGFYLLPNIVWILYSMIYTMPEFYTTYRLGIGLMGTLIAFICICGVTVFVAYGELKQMPSVLMRPKVPKKRKKDTFRKNNIYMEKTKFL